MDDAELRRALVESVPAERDQKPMSPAEFEARLAGLLADEAGMARKRELIAYFCDRFPTAKDRLDHVRKLGRELRGI